MLLERNGDGVIPDVSSGIFGLIAGPVLGALFGMIVIFSGGGWPMAWRAARVICVLIWCVAIFAMIAGHFNPGKQ